TVRVPVHLIGDAKGLKSVGAILMHPTDQLEVECTVSEIPDYLEVNIEELDVDHAIVASEVKLGGSMKLKTDAKAMVAQIVIQLEEVVNAPTAEAAAVEGAPGEPEVITAKKKEGEEGAEGEAAAKPGAKGAAPAAAGKGAAAPAGKGAA